MTVTTKSTIGNNEYCTEMTLSKNWVIDPVLEEKSSSAIKLTTMTPRVFQL
jgi:hypothetical protein